jgi:cytochrome c oxidase cbb3-type subunit 4
MMDVNDARAIITLISFAVFIGICWWASSPKRADKFKEAERLPLDES